MSIDEIIKSYETVVKVVDEDAHNQQDRAYGGMIREIKGKLQEYITTELVKLAWKNLNGKDNRLEINSKKIPIKIQRSYIDKIKDEQIKNYIINNINSYYYGLSVDKHVFIDNEFGFLTKFCVNSEISIYKYCSNLSLKYIKN